jgi:hypothetical protein
MVQPRTGTFTSYRSTPSTVSVMVDKQGSRQHAATPLHNLWAQTVRAALQSKLPILPDLAPHPFESIQQAPPDLPASAPSFSRATKSNDRQRAQGESVILILHTESTECILTSCILSTLRSCASVTRATNSSRRSATSRHSVRSNAERFSSAANRRNNLTGSGIGCSLKKDK